MLVVGQARGVDAETSRLEMTEGRNESAINFYVYYVQKCRGKYVTIQITKEIFIWMMTIKFFKQRNRNSRLEAEG